MKVKLVGGGSFYGPHGVMLSYAPGTVIDVAISDAEAVEFWRVRVEGGAAELVEGKLPKAGLGDMVAERQQVTPSSDELDIEAGPDRGEGEPPRSGPGSGKAAWAAYAESQGFDVTDDMTRDDIIAAIDES